MERVAARLIIDHALICGAELRLIKGITKAFARLSHLFFDFFFVFRNLILNQNVGAVAFFAVAVIDQRIVERIDVARSLPYRRVHKDCGVDTYDIFVEQHHTLPPILLNIILQFYAVLSVVVNGSKAIVNITAGKDKSIFLAMGYDFLKYIFLRHTSNFLLYIFEAKLHFSPDIHLLARI